jgi:hypothetical protein
MRESVVLIVSATISEVASVGDHTSRGAVVMEVAIAGSERVGHACVLFGQPKEDSFGFVLTCCSLLI